MKYYQFALLLFGMATFMACNKDDCPSTEEQLIKDKEIIENYLSENNLTAQTTASGLYYIEEEQGSGDFPKSDDLIELNYTGYLSDNSVWAFSYYGSDVLSVQGLSLPGLKEAIPLFRIGSKGKVLLTSELALGPNDCSTGVMYFDIELTQHCLTDSTIAGKVACLDQEKIQRYLTENNLVAESKPSGLHYIIEEPGVGNAFPLLTDFVKVRYKGYLLTGGVFDQTNGDVTANFQLSDVIKGWQEGIRLLKKGGKATFLIPSDQAYSGSPPSNSIIPKNAVLLFDVELVDF